MSSRADLRARYALDTNIFIDAFNNASAASELDEFFRQSIAMTFLSAVVVQELRAGAHNVRDARELDRSIIQPFERRGRVFTPSAPAFKESGRLLSELAAAHGREFVRARRSLPNDALLATSCRERGITLISRDRDFERFGSLLGQWRAIQPWP